MEMKGKQSRKIRYLGRVKLGRIWLLTLWEDLPHLPPAALLWPSESAESEMFNNVSQGGTKQGTDSRHSL